MLPDRPPAPSSLDRWLAFDTSTELLVMAAAGPAGEFSWSGPGGAAASGSLLPQAQQLLARAGLVWAELQAIAFGAGPGAFTGLRSSCAVAQGLALGVGCPVLALDSLALVAQASRWREGAPVWVAMDARIDEIYAAAYGWSADGWLTLDAPALYTVDALVQRWQAEPPARLAGNAWGVFGARLAPALAADKDPGADRAGALLPCARAAWAGGQAMDPALALPVYVRDKVASTVAERAELAERRRQLAAAAASAAPAAGDRP